MKAKIKDRYVIVFRCNDKMLRSEDYPKTYDSKQAAQAVVKKAQDTRAGMDYQVKTLKAK